jgi:tetratricopeptide (TPR) repeat protein
VALDPKLSDARVQMAVALAALNRLPEAGQAYQQALLLNPDQPEVLSRFALVLSRLDLPDAALTCHHRAIELRPDNAELHLALASSLMHHRDTPAAIAALRQALALNPTCAEAWQRLGTCLSTTGDFDQAGAAFRQALALDADDIEASRGLAAINQPASPQPSGIPLGDAAAGAEPAEVARLTAILAQSDLPSEQRIAAGFAAAERLDRQDRYDEAFACVATANALARAQDEASGQAFAIGPLRRQVNEAIAHCTPDFFAHTRGWGNPSALPVLVVGMPRSGTTLVEQIAASHAAVVGAGELLDLNQAARLLMLANPGRAVADWDAVAARSHADAYVARLAALGGDAARVVDKMPDNVLVLGIAAALLPRARVILCRRDLRDVCLSCHFQHFAEGQPFSHDLIDCAHRALEVERLMVHWRAVLPVPVLEMRYEALVGDPESEIRRLIDFLGLPWDPACLDFHRTARPILTASGWQVRQPLYATSVGRWRHYARHLGPLLATLAGKTAQKA